jgi:hypothetical protein
MKRKMTNKKINVEARGNGEQRGGEAAVNRGEIISLMVLPAIKASQILPPPPYLLFTPHGTVNYERGKQT